MRGVCDVCEIVDGNKLPKEVGYCPMCKAQMCAECRRSPGRRAKAWVLRGLKGLPKREAGR